ncbi:MAG: hypothetical protein JWO58_469 [Chitinophagaceae bacterium]|nr:hypothetical protein [Chitinophagaceae bacterium]
MKSIVSYLIVIALSLVAGWFLFGKKTFQEESTITNDAAITKIQAIGKLELVQLNIKDVLEYKIKRDYLPDSRMLIMVNGEMAGCVDLQKISDSDISETKDTLTLLLPAPEVCYTKINHNKSKVYNASTFSWLDNETEMVESLYKKADAYFASDSIKSIIVAETKKNAPTILVPLLENISNKKVVLHYK